MTKLSEDQIRLVKSYILRLEQAEAEIERKKAEYKKRRKAIKHELAEIYRAAERDGHSVRELKRMAKEHLRERRQREREQISQKKGAPSSTTAH
jgi:hypothetical protein